MNAVKQFRMWTAATVAVIVMAAGGWAQTGQLAAPVITTTSLSSGEAGVSYDRSIEAAGGDITWSLSGNAPSWLQIHENYGQLENQGLWHSYTYIYGTPEQTGTFNFAVRAENAAGFDEKDFTIVIRELQPPVITATNLSSGEIGVSYTSWIDKTGYNITWSVVSGSLPPGLELDVQNGYINGTPEQTGTFNFTVRAENAAGFDTKNFTVTITELQPPVITTTNLSNGEIDVSYGVGVHADASNVTWSVVSGSLPPGLQINSGWRGNGYSYTDISGTPAQTGTFTFTVRAENAAGFDTKVFTITITELLPPVINTTSLPNGEIGVSYGWYGIADGSNVTLSVISGILPPGVQINDNRYIGGTPAQTGTFTFTVRAENAAGSDTKEYTIFIGELLPPVINTISLSNGEKGVSYGVNVHADASNVTWSVVSGSLPPGLQINSGWGGNGYSHTDISGTPAQTGTFSFTVRAENAAGFAAKEYTITITELLPPVITRTELSNGEIGVSYETNISADGSNITWSVAQGILPPGLDFDYGYGGQGYSYRYLRGTPTQTGEYTFTVRAENAAGFDTKEYTVTITELLPPDIYDWHSLRDGEIGVYYDSWIERTGNNITWSYTGSLPPGLELDVQNGYINGTPTQTGEYTFTVRAENAAGFDTKEYTIAITELQPPAITTTELYSGEKGASYWTDVRADGSNVTWNIVSGSLPPGVQLNGGWGGNGYSYIEIGGTPAQAGAFTFTLRAENAAGTDTKEFTIVIGEPQPPVITTTELYSGIVNEYYGINISADGFNITWSVSGELPSGLQFDGYGQGHGYSYMYINGTPRQTGTYTFTVRAENNLGADAKVFTVFIGTYDDPNSVVSEERVIPQSKPPEEAAVIAPVKALSGEFTAGPNPILKSSGIMNFYRQGRRVANCELRIYDATGNVISKVKIRDNVIGTQAKRIVGSWDLKDKKGKIVSEGTYLVKGVIKTSDGKSEKVSVIIGVR